MELQGHNEHQALKHALEDAIKTVILDENFLNQVTEEIIDRLDGVDDEALGKLIEEAKNSPKVSREEVIKALREE